MEDALAAYNTHLGPDHPATLAAAHHLARLLSRLNTPLGLKKARRYSMQALEGREKVLGASHPETLSTVDHLSVVMTMTGRYKICTPPLIIILADTLFHLTSLVYPPDDHDEIR